MQLFLAVARAVVWLLRLWVRFNRRCEGKFGLVDQELWLFPECLKMICRLQALSSSLTKLWWWVSSLHCFRKFLLVWSLQSIGSPPLLAVWPRFARPWSFVGWFRCCVGFFSVSDLIGAVVVGLSALVGGGLRWRMDQLQVVACSTVPEVLWSHLFSLGMHIPYLPPQPNSKISPLLLGLSSMLLQALVLKSASFVSVRIGCFQGNLFMGLFCCRPFLLLLCCRGLFLLVSCFA